MSYKASQVRKGKSNKLVISSHKNGLSEHMGDVYDLSESQLFRLLARNGGFVVFKEEIPETFCPEQWEGIKEYHRQPTAYLIRASDELADSESKLKKEEPKFAVVVLTPNERLLTPLAANRISTFSTIHYRHRIAIDRIPYGVLLSYLEIGQ